MSTATQSACWEQINEHNPFCLILTDLDLHPVLPIASITQDQDQPIPSVVRPQLQPITRQMPLLSYLTYSIALNLHCILTV